jgi:hypothetical protein
MRCRYGLAEPLRREQELSSVRAGDGMGFTAFRTEKSVSEEILRGEEAEVGGWEGVFGSGELRSFLGFGGGVMGLFWGREVVSCLGLLLFGFVFGESLVFFIGLVVFVFGKGGGRGACEKGFRKGEGDG